MMSRLRQIATAAFIAAATLPGQSGWAATVYVQPGQSIQSAIDAASAGDAIVVLPGTYYESIDMRGKGVELRSLLGAAQTVIDGSNTPGSVINMLTGETNTTVIDGFTLTGGTGRVVSAKSYGGGIYIKLANPIVRNCVVTGNTAEAGGGLAAITMTSGLIENCVFSNNLATAGGTYGGGGGYVRGGLARIYGCSFIGNETVGAAKGGGLTLFLGRPTFVNCIIYDNISRHGGGIMNNESEALFVNCTIARNHATSTGGGMRNLYSDARPTLVNSIVWGNTAIDEGDQILDQLDAATTVNYSTVDGGWTGAGTNVGVANPMFTDLDGGNLRLGPESPCIDAADNTALPDDVDLDIDGDVRFLDDPYTPDTGVPDGVNAPADLGAWEFQEVGAPPCAADLNNDGLVSFDDVLLVLSAWGPCSGCGADIDADGDVTLSDLLLVLFAWGSCG